MDVETILKYKSVVIFIVLCCYVLGFLVGSRQSLQPNMAPRNRRQKDRIIVNSGNVEDDYRTSMGEPVFRPTRGGIATHVYEEKEAEDQPETLGIADSKTGENKRYHSGVAKKEVSGTPATSLAAIGGKCSQESRISLYKSVCRKNNNLYPTSTVRELYVDTDNQLATCINKKAGSVSWMQFLVRNKHPSYGGGHFMLHEETFLKSHGFNDFFNIPKENVSKQFRDWSKIIVVRHPLQRAVSGYYQGLVFPEKTGRNITVMMTFLEFIQKLVAEQLNGGGRSIMWKRYYISCCVCDIDYDVIVKQETLEKDVETFKKLYGFRKDNNMGMTDLNKKVMLGDVEDSRFKYDEMLGKFQDEHPELMRGLLNHYKFDMELFGYGWDWDRRKSFCIDNNASGCC